MYHTFIAVCAMLAGIIIDTMLAVIVYVLASDMIKILLHDSWTAKKQMYWNVILIASIFMAFTIILHGWGLPGRGFTELYFKNIFGVSILDFFTRVLPT